eukprot:TRINITY_DN8716_c0_g1_i1.p1 TRINITY_DN8716_c0_g1~~TRINITY_DN8716_c0_g1_i1.p1  ORF type:complete len:179 (-),score=6.54 TRINITY_DN8716_c0_g1_i1:247-783(-)
MNINDIKAKIEAILFAHANPITCLKLAEILETEEDEIEPIIKKMQDDIEEDNRRGITIIKLNGEYQLVTKTEYASIIEKALNKVKSAPLSQAALEVLAVVAYNQPVTKAFIEQVRGVDCSELVRNLIRKELIEEKGRLDLPGRPLLYGTTVNFLRCFGINSISELPNQSEFEKEKEEL